MERKIRMSTYTSYWYKFRFDSDTPSVTYSCNGDCQNCPYIIRDRDDFGTETLQCGYWAGYWGGGDTKIRYCPYCGKKLPEA